MRERWKRPKRLEETVTRRGLAERLLAELNRQLDARGLVVKSGTLVDASLVEPGSRRPRKDEPREGRLDPDASWNAMPEKPLFGYKMHLAVDQGSGLVRRAILTPADVSDRTPFLGLVQGDERAVYADRGYDGWWYRRELAERGVADGVMAGSYWRRPLDDAGHARNRVLGRIRAPVKRSFAVLKRAYGYARVRAMPCGCRPALAGRGPDHWLGVPAPAVRGQPARGVARGAAAARPVARISAGSRRRSVAAGRARAPGRGVPGARLPAARRARLAVRPSRPRGSRGRPVRHGDRAGHRRRADAADSPSAWLRSAWWPGT